MERDPDLEAKIQSLLEDAEHDNEILAGNFETGWMEENTKRKKKKRAPNKQRMEQLSRPLRRPQSPNEDLSKRYESRKLESLSPEREKALIDRLGQPRNRKEPSKTEVVYLHGNSEWNQPGGGRFSNANPKSWIDWKIYMSKEVPGPGSYAESATHYELPKGGRFNEARPPSALEQEIQQKKDYPGPGGNGGISSALQSAGVGKIQMARGKTELDWDIIRAKQLPGPGEYNPVDPAATLQGGRFGKHNPKSDLDNVIYRAKDLPGPLDYYAERSYKSLSPASSPKGT